MNFPVFDLHCDTAFAMFGGDHSLHNNSLHIDLERAATLDGYCQCFACYTTPLMEQWRGETAVSIFQKELSCILHELESNRHAIRLAKKPEDIQQNRLNGIMSAVLTIEGPAGFDYDPQRLESLFQTGFRMTTLGWNESNPLTGSHATGEGLTAWGREFVMEAQRLGMLVDVSHISDAGFWDIMEITQGPVVASHSNSRAICGHSRNLSDEMFLAICSTGGVAGLNLYADFIGGKADMDIACDHILHFLELDPTGCHIALGGDLDGCDCLCQGIAGIQDYPRLADKLTSRGVDSGMIENIFWNNAMGVMNRAICNNQK